MGDPAYKSCGQGVLVMAHSLTAAEKDFGVTGLDVPEEVQVRVDMDGKDSVVGKALLVREPDGSVTARAELLCSSSVFATAYVNEEMEEFIGWSPRFEKKFFGSLMYLHIVSVYITPEHDPGCYLTLF